jgi:hypothetical protein
MIFPPSQRDELAVADGVSYLLMVSDLRGPERGQALLPPGFIVDIEAILEVLPW